jgi:hypothetical protein
MPKALVVGATGLCEGPSKDHGGTIKFSAGNSLLAVSGAGAVVTGQEVGLSIAACLHQMPNPAASPPKIPAPCTLTKGATGGISRKLRVQGRGVLLEVATGLATSTDSAEKPTWKITAVGQSLLSVDS